MNATVSGCGVELGRDDNRGPAQDVVVLLEAADPGLELADLSQFLARCALALPAVDLGLYHPAVHRLWTWTRCREDCVSGCGPRSAGVSEPPSQPWRHTRPTHRAGHTTTPQVTGQPAPPNRPFRGPEPERADGFAAGRCARWPGPSRRTGPQPPHGTAHYHRPHPGADDGYPITTTWRIPVRWNDRAGRVRMCHVGSSSHPGTAAENFRFVPVHEVTAAIHEWP